MQIVNPPPVRVTIAGLRTSKDEANAAYDAAIRIRHECDALIKQYGAYLNQSLVQQFWQMDAQFWKDREAFFKEFEVSYGEFKEQAQDYEKRYAEFRRQFTEQARAALESAGQTDDSGGFLPSLTRTSILPGVKPEYNTWIIAGVLGVALAIGISLALRKK